MGLTEVPARAVRQHGVAWTLERIREVTGGADHLFVAVDIDVLDPAHAPGVGWHEPGGLTAAISSTCWWLWRPRWMASP